MKKEIIYSALFVNDIEVLKTKFPPIHEKHYYHHCTIAFKPENTEGVAEGKVSELKIIGIVADDQCQALVVETDKSKNRIPHITLSCTENTAPVYANFLCANGTIEYFKTPFYVEVTEGFKYDDKS